jgi:hypothetical protein
VRQPVPEKFVPVEYGQELLNIFAYKTLNLIELTGNTNPHNACYCLGLQVAAQMGLD